jgi:hypothetical protein
VTFAQAVAVSGHLAEAGHSHAVQVGVHDGLTPRLTCRIDLHMRSIVEGMSLTELRKLESFIASNVEGVQMHLTAFGGTAVYFS